MRYLTTTLALSALLAPLPLRADDSEPTIPVANPQAKVQSVKRSCKKRYAGQKLGSLDPATFCEVYAWSELGKSYPALLKVARKLERKYNKRAGQLEEVRSQLRREREHADELSAKLGKQQAKLDELEGRMPRWLTWTLTGVAVVAGGAAGYGIAQLLP